MKIDLYLSCSRFSFLPLSSQVASACSGSAKETSEYCVGFVRAMKTAERREFHRSGEDIINFESMLHSVSIVNLKRVKILKREIFAWYQIFPFPTCH